MLYGSALRIFVFSRLSGLDGLFQTSIKKISIIVTVSESVGFIHDPDVRKIMQSWTVIQSAMS